MDILPANLQNYLETFISPESDLLHALNRDTNAHILSPRMLSGHYQGRFLAFLSKLIQPKYILEIGTFTGYSALCLAEGLPPEGELHTLEINEELEDRIQDYFNKSVYKNQLHLHIGDAKDIIKKLNFKFQLVFIDADKGNYSVYYDLVVPKMSQGGLIIIDNVLWSGKVYDPLLKPDKKTQYIHDFNQKVHEDTRVESIILPVRDGLMLAFVK